MDRRALAVFRAGGRTFTAGEVLATAPARPAPAAAGEAVDDEALDDEALDAAIAEYRYARDLVSAQECESWLASRGLEYGDLVGYLRRSACSGEGVSAEPGDALADALLDPGFDRHARELARLAALACEQGEALAEVDVEAAWPRWNALADAWQRQHLDGAARRRELELQAPAWTRLGGLLVEFDAAAAAREARLCVEADGEDLAQLARAQGLAWREFAADAGQLPAALARTLAHAPVGSLQAAQLEDGRHCLLRLAARIPPRLDDPQIAARVDATLRARALDALVCRHVHWILPLHHG